MKRTWLAGVVLGIVAALASQAQGQVARNVIVMIADGQGFNSVEAARYFTGQDPVFKTFDVACAASTYSATGLLPANVYPGAAPGYDPAKAWNTDYPSWKGSATDSSSAATAIYTGIRTRDGRVNVSADEAALPLVTLAQVADLLGKSTGAVSTVQWSHATPGAVWAHNISRNHYAEIANEMVFDSGLDVIIGAGHPGYDENGAARTADPDKWQYQYVGGRESWERIVSGTTGQGWTFTDDKARIEQIAGGIGVPQRLLVTIQAATTAQQARKSGNRNVVQNGFAGTPDTRNRNVPDLATMSRAALNVLNRNPNGFFVSIEGGAVDWANHNNEPGRMIEEQMDFHAAVQAVANWVETHSSWDETLLIVTADHETGFLWGPNTGAPAEGKAPHIPARFDPIRDNGTGAMPAMRYHSGGHTNSLVPLHAKGAGVSLFVQYATSYDIVRGPFVNNTDIRKVAEAAITNPLLPGLLAPTGQPHRHLRLAAR